MPSHTTPCADIPSSPHSLCIAHRLATIAFYDRVIVLDAGAIVEFDTPLNLYDLRDSVFRGMCDAANLNKTDILRIKEGSSLL